MSFVHGISKVNSSYLRSISIKICSTPNHHPRLFKLSHRQLSNHFTDPKNPTTPKPRNTSPPSPRKTAQTSILAKRHHHKQLFPTRTRNRLLDQRFRIQLKKQRKNHQIPDCMRLNSLPSTKQTTIRKLGASSFRQSKSSETR